MCRLQAKKDYENLRNARIVENEARMASLGLERSSQMVKQAFSSPKSTRKYTKQIYPTTSLRRSNRLMRKTPPPAEKTALFSVKHELKEGPVPRITRGRTRKLSEHAANLGVNLEDVLAQRCNSKGRGSLYDTFLGICCHFCRQKKLCGEEDCLRCGYRDAEQPCLGKTDCSVCHSSTGVFCRACLKIRYGEDIEEVRKCKNWMCPHCVEAKGLRPYWICNSSFCLLEHKLQPTGIAIYKARKMGYESVAHLLMHELKKKRL